MKRAKKDTKKSQCSGELFSGLQPATQLRADLAQDKKLRKKLYKEIWKRWDRDAVSSLAHNQSGLSYYLNTNNWGYQVVANYYKLLSSLNALDLWDEDEYSNMVDDMQDIGPLYDWIWPKATKYLLKKVYEDKIPFPMLNKTEALKEFLFRGFVHWTDFPSSKVEGKFYIKTHIGELRYPKVFDQHQDAINFMSKVGIPG